MRQRHIFVRDRVDIHRETVILRRDIYRSRTQVLHRLIASVVAKF